MFGRRPKPWIGTMLLVLSCGAVAHVASAKGNQAKEQGLSLTTAAHATSAPHLQVHGSNAIGGTA
jgi:hypothetical protein